MIKIASYNVNGIRAALKKDLVEWIKASDLDMLCIQETKSKPEQADVAAIEALGYEAIWHSAAKKGYSGVLTFTKQSPESVIVGMDIPKYDDEGRVLLTAYSDFALLNVYIPSGSSGERRHQFKMEFLEDFKVHVKKLQKEYPKLVIVGDYNIVHTELDIHNPERRDNPSGYRPDERAWLTDWLKDLQLVDAYRELHPEEVSFSWWSYRAASRRRNKGWRIDYAAVSDQLLPQLQASYMDADAVHSDHCPVILELDI